MVSSKSTLPEQDTILSGPFWPERVRVLSATANHDSIRIQAVGVTSNQYFDRTLALAGYKAQVIEEVGTGYHFDADPRLFRLATEALRTHLAHTFDPEFAVSVSQVDPLPHQLDAVYRHILPLPRIRFLLADDPGAGKTIMAGLLMRELMQRQGIRRVLVLCPKALTDQWRREMWERFRARFTLLTGDQIVGAFGQNAWTANDLVVASVDLAVQDHILPGLEQSSWDLVIFDEAHKLSAYRYGSKIDKTKRYQLAERLAERTKHLLLMTATPHKGDDENFRLLLALLDQTVFATRAGLSRALDRDHSPYFLRRMKESMRGFDGKPLFLPRHVETVAYSLEPHEEALYEAVTDYVANGLEQAESTRNRNVGLALTVLQRRLASSLFAITRSLERRRLRLAEELDQATASGRRERRPDRDISHIILDADEDLDELSDEDEDALSAASNAHSLEELRAEVAVLDGLIHQARAAMRHGPEKKLREFLQVVESETVQRREEKILVFTEHKDTLTYVTEQLRERGYRVTNIHGGMKLQDRIAAEKDFRGPSQFLVATDAAGEGINLQFCRVMINWDLPWSPVRLEQRMGRIHRYGQEYEVQIYNLVAENTREGAVLVRLMAKLEAMRKAMGHDQVYDVISGVLDGAQVRLDVLLRQAILNRRSRSEILAELDVVEGNSARAAARQALGEALATRYIDMAFINGEERASKERRLTPEYVERFFVDALRHLGGRVERGADHDWRLDFVPAEIRRVSQSANTGEFGSANRLITFYKERLRQDPPAEFVAPDHPLFDAVAAQIRAEGLPALGRGTVFVDKHAREPYLVWLLEAGVVNGLGELVHKRLLALRQHSDRFEAVEPGVILDLPPTEHVLAVPKDLALQASADAAVSFAATHYANDYLTVVAAAQERQATIVEDALRQSGNDNLERLQTRLERQYADMDQGKDMALAIRTTNEQIDALSTELRQRQEELERRKVTAVETPHVVGIAAVLPGSWFPEPRTRIEGVGDMTKIERAAMEVAEAYERAAGREPEDVSKTGVGYDIKSTGPDGDMRYIEVKGHTTTGDVTLYYTEWQTAHRMRAEFFIYEVNYALTTPELWITRDPVGWGIEPEEKVVEYRVRAEQLRAVAARAE